eukprot:gene3335-15309_t
MTGHYLDAMTIVAAKGKPDYFITMTANPKWPEILANLRPGEKDEDRPDLMARVFYLYWKALLHDLLVLGTLGYAPRTAADIDKVVSAELPCERTQPAYFKLVTTSMLHG